jgi:hypothetical protein
VLHLCGHYCWFGQSNSLFAGYVPLGGLWVSLWAVAATRCTSLIVELRWSLSFSSYALSSLSIGHGSLLQARSNYTFGDFIRLVVFHVVFHVM